MKETIIQQKETDKTILCEVLSKSEVFKKHLSKEVRRIDEQYAFGELGAITIYF